MANEEVIQKTDCAFNESAFVHLQRSVKSITIQLTIEVVRNKWLGGHEHHSIHTPGNVDRYSAATQSRVDQANKGPILRHTTDWDLMYILTR